MFLLHSPLRDGTFARVSYNGWEKFLLGDLFLISAFRTVAVGGALDERTSRMITTLLYILPTAIILLACLSRQCFHKNGGYSRIRHLSIARWWRQRRARTQTDGQHDQLCETVLQDMLSDMRDPLLIDQLRHPSA